MIVGWVGVGRMGLPMARRLIDAGHELHFWSRRWDDGGELIAAGARRCEDRRDLASTVEAVVTIVGGPDDVRSVYLGEDGLLSALGPGRIAIDATTSSPELARDIAATAATRDIAALDAPVSGGPIAAADGTLSIMVGGEAGDVERARPVLAVLGRSVVHVGPAGSGQAAKLVNQVLLAGSTAGIVEAFALADRLGLDPRVVADALGAGIAASPLLGYLWPRLAAGDFEPGFSVDHMRKDLTLALGAAGGETAGLPTTEGVLARYRLLAEDGYGGAGTQALLQASRRTGWQTDGTSATADPR